MHIPSTWRCALLTCALAGCTSTGPTAPAPVSAIASESPAVPAATAPSRPTALLDVDPASDASFRPRVEKRLSTSGLAADLVLDAPADRHVDYTVRLKFTFRELPLSDAEGVWGLTDMFLLTLYPASCNRYRFSLVASVEDASGHRIKTYSMQDLDTAWVWLLVGPNCSSPEGFGGDGVGDTAEDLLTALYRRMAQDEILDPARLAALLAGRGPLVYVTVTGDGDPVKEGLQLDESPVRFTFDPQDAATADYTLPLELHFSGRNYSAGRAALALMTIGMSGFCPTQTATLEGSAYDRSGRLVEHYRSEAHWQPPMSPDCSFGGPPDRPVMIRALAQELAAKISLPAVGATAAARPDSPAIRLTTNAARAVVERVTAERRPFANVSLDDSPSTAVDYRLALAFSATGGGSRLQEGQSVGKAVATGFMFGITFGNMRFLCHPTEYRLVAELSDASGAVLATQQATESETSTAMGCGPDPEPPEDVAGSLLNAIYAQLAKDPHLPSNLRVAKTRHR